jgi:hypothetical protein
MSYFDTQKSQFSPQIVSIQFFKMSQFETQMSEFDSQIILIQPFKRLNMITKCFN